ncbi:Pr6Pr family membrane protein [Crenobacter cavernae]|uniref:Integral membrane protein n=1 Tax=Crenobacter cavernae TaxID=2290923 RepID=A0A345Y8X5_9NEIS|nr:Pr6Pr family membrane protein [Crenobacter cavernae]AXK40377.1 hypothetical protein DWG20_13590 [Crenobacter cavernae]
MNRHQTGTLFAAAAGVSAWFALGLQFYLTNALVLSQGRGFLASLFVFFGYFTILTNLLAAVAFTVAVLRPAAWFRLFLRPSVLGGIAVSIALVGIVYSLLLRQTWQPTGAQLVADGLLHDVMPLVFIVYWWLWVPKTALCWRDALRWALYPMAYLVYALLRGALSGTYPYPFIDVARLGYGVAFKNSVVILMAFLGIATLFIVLGRRKDPAPSNASS